MESTGTQDQATPETADAVVDEAKDGWGIDNDDFEIQSDFEELDLETDVEDIVFPDDKPKEEIPAADDKPAEDDEDGKPIDFSKPDDKPAEEGADSDISVEALNKMFGTNYETKDQFKELLNGGSEQSSAVSEEDYTKAEGHVNYLTEALALDDKQLLLNNEILIERQRAKIAGEEIDEESLRAEVEDKLKNWEDSGSIGPNAMLLRQRIEKAMEQPQAILNKRLEVQKEVESKREQTIQEAMNQVYTSGDFFGIKPEKADIKKVYQEVANGSLLESIKKDANLAVKVGLFVQYQNEIQKRATGPTKSDGVREVLDEISAKRSSATLSKVADSNSKGSSVDSEDGLINAWMS